MAVRFMALRRDDRCAQCEMPIRASTEAWWDPSAREVTCVRCMPATEPPADTTSVPRPDPIEEESAGAAADREAQRNRAHRERRRQHAGTMRPGAWATSQTTTYAQDSVGERRVRAALDSLTDSGAVVLHDRQVPNTRGNIDHVVIAASGVWIIDARNWEGRVQRRWVGRRAGRVLFVDGHNRMDAVDKLAWQIQAVRAALTPIGFADAPVTGVLCFTGATWGLLARPLRFGNAVVTWPAKLVTEISGGPPADSALIDLVAQQLRSKLPAIR